MKTTTKKQQRKDDKPHRGRQRRSPIAQAAARSVLSPLPDPLATFTGAPRRSGAPVVEEVQRAEREVIVRTSISISEEDHEWLRQEAMQIARATGNRRADASRVIRGLIAAEKQRRSKRSGGAS